MTQLEALVSLNMVSDIGSIRLKKLLEYFATPQDILKASPGQLTAVSGIGEKIARNIVSFKKQDLDRELKSAEKMGLRILTPDDAVYPENLKNIVDPPIVLYVKGELKEQDKLSIAIVGSRRASFYGLSSAEKFAAALSACGLTVVSGMARGVDSYAHKGALKAGGRTIAVIGSGFAQIYPPENKKLAQEVAQNGAVVSEFPIDAKPLRENFPRRNRVISGLSLGTLVVEAARNSGALITADFALEQGREVFALPGKIDSETSFGTNQLIKQGAKLVSDVEDIIEELNLSNCGNFALDGRLEKTAGASSACFGVEIAPVSAENCELTAEESLLYNSLSGEPLHLDDIAGRLGLGIPQILNTLLNLEMKKLIRQLPGKQFAKIESLQ
jgi:DNA processing protein